MAFSFGAPAASTTSSFSFGAPASGAASTSGFGGGFGSTAPAATSSTGGFGGGFGAAPAAATGGFGSFGAATPAAATSTGGFGGGFGAPAAPAATGGFGSGGFGGGFGSTAAAPASTGFGGGFGAATAAPATSTGGFGGLGGFSQQQQPQQQQQGAPLVVNTITQHMQAVYNSYDPTSPTCRFQTIFYDRKHPKEVAALQDQAPLHANKRLWTRAQQSNPDPVNLALEQGNSFQDLKSRIQKQDVAAQTLEKHVEANVQALESMQKKHEDMRTTIVAMREEHATLTFRLLQMVTNIEMERARGQTLTEPELEYHKKLQHLMRMLDQPGKFKSKVHELDSLIGRLQNGRGTEQPFLSAESLGPAAGQLLEVLRVQKESLAYLTATLRKDFADASAVVNQLEYQARSLQPRLPAPDGANGNAAMRY